MPSQNLKANVGSPSTTFCPSLKAPRSTRSAITAGGRLLKSLQFINEQVENQLSFLSGFKRWLLNLQMGSVPEAKSAAGLFIEVEAELREGLIRKQV